MRTPLQSNQQTLIRGLAWLLPGLLALLPAVGLASEKFEQSEQSASRPASCNLYLELAQSAVPSRERSYALRALRECAPGPVIARTLEAALLSDDFAARAAALTSLDRHLDRKSVPVLLAVLNRETPHSRHPERVVQIYRYLSRLAGPLKHSEDSERSDQAVPAYLFVEGLDHADVRIREASLHGLGRSGQADPAWPLLYRTLLAPRTVRDHVAALRASRTLSARRDPQARRAAGTTLDLLIHHRSPRSHTAAGAHTVAADPALLAAYSDASRHALAQAARAALELLGDLRGPRALERLLLYRLQAGRRFSDKRPGAENQDRLQALINARLRGLPNTLGRPARSLRSLRVHARPTETSPVLGALAENSIVYIADATTPGYRLPPLRGAAGPEANWLRVTTLRGLAGWVHASRIQRIAVTPAPSAERETSPAPDVKPKPMPKAESPRR